MSSLSKAPASLLYLVSACSLIIYHVIVACDRRKRAGSAAAGVRAVCPLCEATLLDSPVQDSRKTKLRSHVDLSQM